MQLDPVQGLILLIVVTTVVLLISIKCIRRAIQRTGGSRNFLEKELKNDVEKILFGISVLFVGPFVAYGAGLIIEIGNAGFESFISLLLIILVLELIFMFILAGSIISFSFFKLLKYAFNVE